MHPQFPDPDAFLLDAPDGLEPDEADAIRVALANGRPYRGGAEFETSRGGW